MAVVTGGTARREENGGKLETVQLADLGSAAKVTATKENTGIVDGAGDEKDIKGRIEEIRREIELSTSDYDGEKLQERLAKLSGGVAILRVGAATETDLKEKKHRAEDALSATRAAAQEGIAHGGGVALREGGCRSAQRPMPWDTGTGVRQMMNMISARTARMTRGRSSGTSSSNVRGWCRPNV